MLGAHPANQGTPGTAFAVWAPSAAAVRVVGDWNGWDGRCTRCAPWGRPAVWEIFVPEAQPGHHYKFEVTGVDGGHPLRADPLAQATEVPPANASVVFRSTHAWGDDEWMARRAGRTPLGRAHGGVRDAPRLVDAQPRRQRPRLHDLAQSWPTTCSTWASPTSS